MNYIDIFLEALVAEKGRSTKTVSSYASDLTHADSELPNGLLNATEQDIQNYLSNLPDKASSIARKASALRSFYKFLMLEKIITTNQFIQRYDFYNPTNILIIDRNNPVISDKFFEADYEAVPAEIYNKYSLESWIYEILGLGDECDR